MQAESHSQPSNAIRWERRRYWCEGKLVRLEWWRENQFIRDGPVRPPQTVLHRDFCQAHGTQIYPDLGCQVCRQRPGDPRP